MSAAVPVSLGFRPDPFQQSAIDAIDCGQSVLVVAPTGAGKTLIAEHAIDRALARSRRVFYTTPIKALSNQKHRDLAARLGPDLVGLITGDRTINPTAPIVVMTTEVSRALLYERGRFLDDLDAIVLDEFHHIDDPERGPVWEEVVMHAPRDVTLVCLSATVAEPGSVRDWMANAHGPTELVVETERPVKLHHVYAVGNVQRVPPLLVPVFVDGKVNPTAELLDGPRRRQLRGEGLRERSRERATTPGRRELVAALASAQMLPAIWFVLSRAGCDRAVTELVADDVRLTGPDATHEIRRMVEDVTAGIPASDLKTLDLRSWLTGLEAGVAAHHGGLVPFQRELVEKAFGEGLVPVVFATETLAMGLNLPARTVVIDRVVRADGEFLTGSSFAQLAGRAGRRGIDRTGNAVVPWSAEVGFHQVAALAEGRLAPLRSHLHPTAAMVANLVRLGSPDDARAILRTSLGAFRHEREATAVAADLDAARSATVELAADAAAPVSAAPSGSPATDDVTLEGLEPGDVIVDPGRASTGRVLVTAVRRRRNETVVDGVRVDARRVVLVARDFRRAPVVVGHVDVSGSSRPERGDARALAVALDRVPETRRAGRLAATVAASGDVDDEKDDVRRAQRDRARLAREIDRLERRHADLTAGHDVDLDAMVGLLVERGHLDGWALTTSGELVRRLFHECGLLVAECLHHGLFDGLDAAELAALASCFTARRRTNGPAQAGLPTGIVRDRWPEVTALAADVERAEEAAGLPPTRRPEPILAIPIHRWAGGADLADALAGTQVSPGDLVREIRQVNELLEQIAEVASGPIATNAMTAIALCARGIAM